MSCMFLLWLCVLCIGKIDVLCSGSDNPKTWESFSGHCLGYKYCICKNRLFLRYEQRYYECIFIHLYFYLFGAIMLAIPKYQRNGWVWHTRPLRRSKVSTVLLCKCNIFPWHLCVESGYWGGFLMYGKEVGEWKWVRLVSYSSYIILPCLFCATLSFVLFLLLSKKHLVIWF